MRLRLITILYTILLFFILSLGIYFYNSDSLRTTKNVSVHKDSIEIQKLFQAGDSLSEIESQYSCSILLKSDRHYNESLWECINNNDIMIDLFDSDDSLAGKIVFDREHQAYLEAHESMWKQLFFILLIFALLGYVLIFYIYRSIMLPFKKLQQFASCVAKGNLDLKLPMHKNNFFGAFTESFDLMREELKLAKQREFEANQSKKELVAELSHDIKTPVATIRASCELIEATTEEALTKSKLEIIDSKALTIEQLIDNLFHATLEELQVLKVEAKETSSLFIPSVIEDLKVYATINFLNSIPEYLVYLDQLRFRQVVDNIIYNSYKYAGTPVDVAFSNTDNGILIRISDQGPGMPADELPMASDKFFRGSNATDKSGSGLGLFISKIFMEEMMGQLNYYNDNGFVVELFIKRV